MLIQAITHRAQRASGGLLEPPNCRVKAVDVGKWADSKLSDDCIVIFSHETQFFMLRVAILRRTRIMLLTRIGLHSF